MKKKLLLSFLPVLMIISACSGSGPKVEKRGNFIEETVLREDESAGIQLSTTTKKGVRNQASLSAMPKVAVQFYEHLDEEQEDDKYISLRYVAAVKVANIKTASASWDRTVYNPDGTIYSGLAAEPVVCTKAYETLLEKGEEVTPGSYVAGYNYFLVYTLRYIPTDAFGGSLCASLTFNDGVNASVTTRFTTTLLESKENSIQVALDASDFTSFTTKGSYFLKGKVNGSSSDVVCPADDNLRAGGIASFSCNLNLSSGDNFVVAYSDYTTPANPIFKLLNPSLDGEKTASGVSKIDGKITIGTTAQYILNLENQSTLSSEVAHNVLFKAKAADIDSSVYSVYAVGSFNEWTALPYYKLSLIGDTWTGTFAIPVGDNHNFKFVKCRTAQVDKLAWMDGDNYWFSVSDSDVTLNLVDITAWKYIINIVLTLTSEQSTAVNIIYDLDKSISDGDWINPGYNRDPAWNEMGHTASTTVYSYTIYNVNLNQLFRFMFIRWVADGKGNAEMTKDDDDYRPVSLTITESITINASGTMPMPTDSNDVTSKITYSVV